VKRVFVNEGERMRGTDHVLVGQWILGEVGKGLPPALVGVSAQGLGRDRGCVTVTCGNGS